MLAPRRGAGPSPGSWLHSLQRVHAPPLDGTAALPQAFRPSQSFRDSPLFSESEMAIVAWPCRSGTFTSLMSSVLSSLTVALAGPTFLPLPSAKCPFPLLHPPPSLLAASAACTPAPQPPGPLEWVSPGGAPLSPTLPTSLPSLLCILSHPTAITSLSLPLFTLFISLLFSVPVARPDGPLHPA